MTEFDCYCLFDGRFFNICLIDEESGEIVEEFRILNKWKLSAFLKITSKYANIEIDCDCPESEEILEDFLSCHILAESVVNLADAFCILADGVDLDLFYKRESKLTAILSRLNGGDL